MKSLLKECSDVLILNLGTVTFVSLANIEVLLKIILLSLTIIYTVDKWIYKRKNR
tara:strand:- start:1498 stop:1662 length:165 start_codon:yes stop_codon:yes gene_type:complete